MAQIIYVKNKQAYSDYYPTDNVIFIYQENNNIDGKTGPWIIFVRFSQRQIKYVNAGKHQN